MRVMRPGQCGWGDAGLMRPIYAKIDPKSVPGATPRHPKSSPNRCRDLLRTPHGARDRPRGVSGASRERPWRAPGAPRERQRAAGSPERASGNAPERAETPKIDAASRAGAKKNEFFSLGAFTKRRRSDFSTIFVVFCFSCKGCDVPHVLRLSAKTRVRRVALRVASLARCNLEKRRKPLPKSSENR